MMVRVKSRGVIEFVIEFGGVGGSASFVNLDGMLLAARQFGILV